MHIQKYSVTNSGTFESSMSILRHASLPGNPRAK